MRAYSLSFEVPHKMAFLGDSKSLAGGSDPDYDPRPSFLLSSLKSEEIAPSKGFLPKVLWPSYKDFQDSLSWVFLHMSLSLSKLAIQRPSLSWAYELGTHWGKTQPLPMVFATKEFASSKDLKNQFLEVLATPGFEDTDTFFVLLAGGDLCHSSPGQTVSPKNFSHEFASFLDFVFTRQKQKGASKNIQLVFLSYLGVTQLVGSREILEKKILLPGMEKPVTCQAFLENSGVLDFSENEASMENLELFTLTSFLPFIRTTALCPALYARKSLAQETLSFGAVFDSSEREREIKRSEEDQLAHLSGLIRSYREEMERVLFKKKDEARSAGVRLVLLKEVDSLQFSALDVGSDCMNLSHEGHLKVARKVLDSLAK